MFFDLISLDLIVSVVDFVDVFFTVEATDTFNVFADEGICPRDCD